MTDDDHARITHHASRITTMHPSTSRSPGSTVGPYHVLELLGEGGMGQVYRGRDPRLARDIAIKILPKDSTDDAQAVGRFEREARAIASLSHPNIVAVHD